MVDAKEIKVPDIQPAGFIIEILDTEQKPVAEIEFSVTVDDGNVKTAETDEEGILKLTKPKSKISLFLVGAGNITTDEVSAKSDEKEETVTPL
jgi:uncharacterized GH25 family protein